jgi:ribonuclease HII
MLPTTLPDYKEGTILAGVDECGRGTLCFTVVAAAVVWPLDYQPRTTDEAKKVSMIKDSKKLSPKRREELALFIQEHASAYSIASVDHEVVDQINILQATYKAMHQALDGLVCSVDRIAVDGNKFKPYMNRDGNFIPHSCIVKGDDSLFQIAAASILAKVHRDNAIVELAKSDDSLDVYRWEKNKGYGTKEHMDAIRKYGISRYHRKTFCKSFQC